MTPVTISKYRIAFLLTTIRAKIRVKSEYRVEDISACSLSISFHQ